jgi:hypothetical protein
LGRGERGVGGKIGVRAEVGCDWYAVDEFDVERLPRPVLPGPEELDPIRFNLPDSVAGGRQAPDNGFQGHAPVVRNEHVCAAVGGKRPR